MPYGAVSRDSGFAEDTIEARARRAIAKSQAARAKGSPTARVGEREDAPLLSGDGAVSSDGHVVMQDKKETVDWVAKPDIAKAYLFRKCLMSTCTHNTAPANPDDNLSKGQLDSLTRDGHVREPLDVAAGYEHVSADSIHHYPLWSTTVEELGMIGGQVRMLMVFGGRVC
jgi:hypothetical protein